MDVQNALKIHTLSFLLYKKNITVNLLILSSCKIISGCFHPLYKLITLY